MKPTPRLPTNSAERKKIKLSLVDDYFCDALAEVAKIIAAGQEQHGTTGWDRTKSNDHEDCIRRHSIDRGTRDTDGQLHSAKRAWRALAALQIEIEAERGLPPPRGVSVPSEEDNIREDQALMNIAPPDDGPEYTVKDLMANPPPEGARFRITACIPCSTWHSIGSEMTFLSVTKHGIRVQDAEGLMTALEDKDWRFVRLPPEQLSFNF